MAFVSLRQLLDYVAEQRYDVPVEEIQCGIKSGVRKVHIDTDIRLAMTGAMRKVFAEQPAVFDPRKALVEAMAARFH